MSRVNYKSQLWKYQSCYDSDSQAQLCQFQLCKYQLFARPLEPPPQKQFPNCISRLISEKCFKPLLMHTITCNSGFPRVYQTRLWNQSLYLRNQRHFYIVLQINSALWMRINITTLVAHKIHLFIGCM